MSVIGRKLFFCLFGYGQPLGEFPFSLTPKGDLEILLTLARFVKPSSVLELGVQLGFTAKFLLRECNFIRSYVGIDVPPDFQPALPFQKGEVPTNAGEEAKDDKRFRVYVTPNGSVDLEKPGNSLDGNRFQFVFIDADHSYEGVKRDTRIAQSLLSGGVLVWHDYGTEPGVTQFIDEENQANGNKIVLVESSKVCFQLITSPNRRDVMSFSEPQERNSIIEVKYGGLGDQSCGLTMESPSCRNSWMGNTLFTKKPLGDFVIKVKYGGLGDHLFYSHLPRIAKKQGFARVLISRRSDCRNPEYLKYIWEMNPYVDGFTDEDAPYPEGFTIPESMNLLDMIMLERGLDDGERWHEPEFYFKPEIDIALKDQVIFDPNFISRAGDGIDPSAVRSFLEKDGVTATLPSRERCLAVRCGVEVPTDGSFVHYCSIVASCQKFYCLVSGGATLAAALGKSATVIVSPVMKPMFFHSRRNQYIDFSKRDCSVKAPKEDSHLGGYIPSNNCNPHSDPDTYLPDVWDWLIGVFKPSRVLDVGCGEGWMVKHCKDRGIFAMGVDGCDELLSREVWEGQHSALMLHDFTKGPLPKEQQEPVDLVWSCEFVEHVEEKHTENFLSAFSRGTVVVITHALPGQGGYHHVNCQADDYWIEKMSGIGYALDENLTLEGRKRGKAYWSRSGLVFIRRLSVLVFSKDRPLSLKTCLESLGASSFAVTVFYLATSDAYAKAYAELVAKHPTVKFVRQDAPGDIKPFMRTWLETASDILMVTVDDNVFDGMIDPVVIRRAMADPEVFGFTLRLSPGIFRTQDGRTFPSGPEPKDGVIVYNPVRYQCPWDYVWEISSTFYRKADLERVVESASIANPNELEGAGLQLFSAKTAKKMACFGHAPATNVFVDSWLSPQCVTSPVSNEMALRLYNEDREIDLPRTFHERDLEGVTHVKRLFLKPKKLTNRAIVVIPSRNAEKWTQKCVQSVLGQTYKDLGIIFIDDCSDDLTYDVALGLLVGRLDSVVVSRQVRGYPLGSIDYAVRECCSNPESVIFNLDGDDWLACPTAIAEMMEQHQTADVVWSQYVATDGNPCCCGPLLGDDLRNHPWVTSHLRSFKKFLYDEIKPEDFLDADGKTYKMTGDQAIMLPVLEQTPPNRRRFYDKVLYTYNRDNPINDDKINYAEQRRMEMRIRSQPPYSLHFRYQTPKSLANSAIVIIPSWNTEKWTEKCLRSVLEQTYKDLGIIFIDDHSDDQTLKIAQSILVGRRNTIVISRPERWQALKNWNSVIREQCSNPESVIFQLDGDDWLSCPTAIEEMMKQHRTADVVWSKYVATDGSPCCCSIIRTNDWRNSPWVSSAMRSFKKFLFDAIKPEDFLDWNGKIYELNYDQAIMLPILEMTITERLCFYDKELYIYNRDNPINDDKTHSPQDGWLTTCHIRSRKPYGRHPRYILPKPKPVSVVISSYNQLESLKLALESFYLQSEPPKEVIVADDGSTDGTLEWLGSIPEGKYPFPLHHVTRQHNGYRLASLQNLGAKKATGDRLLFTNADVIHCPTSISSHGRLADNLFGTGVVSSISEEGVKKVTIGHVLNHLLLKKLAEEYPAERTNLVWRKYGPMVHPSAVWGGNLSVSREIFNRIGGFDEGYDVGWGGEDTSLAKRCWERAGVTLVWVDQSVVYHLGHPVKSYALEQKGTERFNATQG